MGPALQRPPIINKPAPLFMKMCVCIFWPTCIPACFGTSRLAVDRRTGFLAPSVHYSSSEGATLSTPYYKTLGPSADITLRPYQFQHRGNAYIYRETDYSDLTANIYIANVNTFKKSAKMLERLTCCIKQTLAMGGMSIHGLSGLSRYVFASL